MMRSLLHFNPPSVTLCRQQWQLWQQCPLAKELAEIEQRVIDPLVARKFGRHLLQISMAGSPPLHRKSPIGNKTFLSFDYPVSDPQVSVVSRPDFLSIANESVDVLILHHVLEFSEDPHKVLREALRVLVSGGQLFIIGFNPLSAWWLRKLFTFKRRAPWSGHYYSQRRVADWLRLLDIRLEDTSFGFFKLPTNQKKLLDVAYKLEVFGQNYNCFFGGIYVMVARKQVAGLMPLQQAWHQHQIISIPVTEPTTRCLKQGK